MAYLKDDDLEFLQNCTSLDLKILVDIIIFDKKGELRLTEELTKNERYRKYFPYHQQYWDLIAAEIQCFGANSITTVLRRGKGVTYRKVLTDVCKKMKVKYKSGDAVDVIEMNLLMKILTDSVEKVSHEDLQALVKDLDLKTTNISKQAFVAALQAGVNLGGFAAYQVSVIVSNACARAVLGSGWSLTTNAAFTRAISVFAGPIGMTLLALWTALGIAGPAYRVTIPCVVQVACLRIKINNPTACSEVYSEAALFGFTPEMYDFIKNYGTESRMGLSAGDDEDAEYSPKQTGRLPEKGFRNTVTINSHSHLHIITGADMKLGAFIAKEQKINTDEVMLLRHSNRMINKLKHAGASIEDDYTFVQPINSKYDFLAENQPPIKVVVVVVDDTVFGVYQVNGVAQIGTSRNLVSQNFIAVDKAEGHKEKPSKKFSMIKLSSASIGRSITGWSCPRYPVARSGHKMFDAVELI